jgi:NADPH2:quinone reductase
MELRQREEILRIVFFMDKSGSMSQSQSAVRLHAFGGSGELRFERVPMPQVKAGEVLIQHRAIGLNFIDTYHRTGLYPVPLPAVLGQEAVGVVAEVGEGVRNFEPGQRVGYCTAGNGSYCQWRCVPADKLAHLPADLSDDDAAALLLKGLTVEYLLRRTFKVEPHHCVLFHAAAGGVGLIALTWLRHLGARVIATVGSAAKVAIAKSFGADEVINYREEDFAERVRALTGGRGVDVAYDSVGKDTLAKSLSVVAPRGMLVSFGNASGKPDAVDPLALSARGSIYLTRPKLGDYVANPAELAQAYEALFERAAQGLRSPIAKVFQLGDVAAAHDFLESRASVGAVVLRP